METDGSYTYGRHSKLVESLCCILEINVLLCVNYTQERKKMGEEKTSFLFFFLRSKILGFLYANGNK